MVLFNEIKGGLTRPTRSEDRFSIQIAMPHLPCALLTASDTQTRKLTHSLWAKLVPIDNKVLKQPNPIHDDPPQRPETP